MDFDSLFDRALQKADSALTNVMASEYELTLKDNSTQPLQAIHSVQVIEKSPAGDQLFKNYKNGVLDVLNEKLDKTRFIDATVTTELGIKQVSDVIYPDETCTRLILTSFKSTEMVNDDYGF